MPSLQDYAVEYPEPEEDELRHVIYLPVRMDGRDEVDHLRVQLIPGRTESCEHAEFYNIKGSVQLQYVNGQKDLPLYRVTMEDRQPSKGVPPFNMDTGEAVFVPCCDNPMVPYCSSAPIVVYTPMDVEVRYRIWKDEESRIRLGAIDDPLSNMCLTLNKYDYDIPLGAL